MESVITVATGLILSAAVIAISSRALAGEGPRAVAPIRPGDPLVRADAVPEDRC